MSPREVRLYVRAHRERDAARINRLLAVAWRNAVWACAPKTIPELSEILIPERPQRQRTLDEDIRRWEIFFAQTRRLNQGDRN